MTIRDILTALRDILTALRDILTALRDAAAVFLLWCAVLVLLVVLTGCASPNPYYWEPLPPPPPQWQLVPGIHYVR